MGPLGYAASVVANSSQIGRYSVLLVMVSPLSSIANSIDPPPSNGTYPLSAFVPGLSGTPSVLSSVPVLARMTPDSGSPSWNAS